MIDDKIKEEISKELKECIKDVWSYPYTGFDVNLVYDTKNECITSYVGNEWYQNCEILLSLGTMDFDWFDCLGCTPCECELQALLRGESTVDLTYSQDIINEAKRIVENEEIDVDDHDEAKYVLKECGAIDVIKQATIDENIDCYMEEEFDKLLDEAIESYDKYNDEKNINVDFER